MLRDEAAIARGCALRGNVRERGIIERNSAYIEIGDMMF